MTDQDHGPRRILGLLAKLDATEAENARLRAAQARIRMTTARWRQVGDGYSALRYEEAAHEIEHAIRAEDE